MTRIRDRSPELTAVVADQTIAVDPSTGTAGKMQMSTLGALEISNDTITTANLAALPGTVHFCTIAGLTASRNVVIPTGVAGQRIGIYVIDGDPDFELIILGDTAVQINNGTAATEWSRLFIKDELLTLFCRAPGQWVVEYDGRIPCIVKYTMTVQQTDLTSGVLDQLDFDTANTDVGNCADVANNEIVVRRNATAWSHGGQIQMAESFSNSAAMVLSITDNAGGSELIRNSRFPAYAPASGVSSSGNYMTVDGMWDGGGSGIAVGDIFEIHAQITVTTPPGSINVTTARTFWNASEVL